MELVKGESPSLTTATGVSSASVRGWSFSSPSAQAVQHAHQKAILHRDLKPSNILVTTVDGKPVPKEFKERRLPTLEEINAAAPDTPVFILRLYCQAMLSGAALRGVGYDKSTPNPSGGGDPARPKWQPTGLLPARPNATILYATLAKGPRLQLEYQYNSTRQFMRELNRLGLTSVCDAGGGIQNYPDDYAVIDVLHQRGELTLPIAKGAPHCRVSLASSWGR